MKSSEKSHKASMNNFDKEYNRTEKEVYKKTYRTYRDLYESLKAMMVRK